MSIDKGVDQEDVVHIHSGILLSHEKERNNGICSNVVGPGNCHAKWSQSDRETPTSQAITSMWNLKKGHKELCRTDTDSQTLKNIWFPNETGWGVRGCTEEGLGWKWKWLWWLLYTCKCDKIHEVIKKKRVVCLKHITLLYLFRIWCGLFK